MSTDSKKMRLKHVLIRIHANGTSREKTEPVWMVKAYEAVWGSYLDQDGGSGKNGIEVLAKSVKDSAADEYPYGYSDFDGPINARDQTRAKCQYLISDRVPDVFASIWPTRADFERDFWRAFKKYGQGESNEPDEFDGDDVRDDLEDRPVKPMIPAKIADDFDARPERYETEAIPGMSREFACVLADWSMSTCEQIARHEATDLVRLLRHISTERAQSIIDAASAMAQAAQEKEDERSSMEGKKNAKRGDGKPSISRSAVDTAIAKA